MTTPHRPFWRRLAQAAAMPTASATAAPACTAHAGLVSAMRPLALEQRFMFDGAAVDAAADAAHAASAAVAADGAHAAAAAQWVPQAVEVHAANPALDNGKKEVVLVDTSLTDYQSLVDNVPAGVEIELFDGSKDGLSQLVQWVQNHSGYDAIHILSHGGEGEVQLGTLTLDSATATARAADLATLGSALTESGDLLLYGCDVAGNTGQSFVSLMAQLTGADIAASTNTTGASAQGGDWELESHTGLIETTALHIDGYQHVLDVTGTTADIVVGSDIYASATIGSGVEFILDGRNNVSESNWYVDINPSTSTITMTFVGDDIFVSGLPSLDMVFSGGTLEAITSITKDNAATTSAADISTSVNGNDKTITFHFNSDPTNGNGVLVWHFSSTNTAQDTAPTVSGTASNPTFTENGAAVALFSGVSADTHDSGQSFTGAQFTVSNVAGTSEYLTIHGVNVALSNGNSVSLGSGYGTASISVSGGLATLNLSGAMLSNADMSSLLSGMTYSNSSDNPGSAARTVTLTQLTDSGTSNNTVVPNISSVVAVVPVNDAPTQITLSNTVLTQSQGSATLSTTDVDSTSFTYSLVSGTGSTDNALFTLSGNTLRAVDASTMSAGPYSIRLRTTDDGGASYEKVVTMVVTDDIAPTFDQAPTASNPTAGGFTLSGSVTEAGGVYYVVVPDGASTPTVAQVIAGQTASGATAFASGSQTLNSAPYNFSLTLAGLAASTMYDVYVVARDSAGNSTVSVVKVDATTASAGNMPSLAATGSSPVFIGGMAGLVDLFTGVSASTNDSGQTFSGLVLTVSNATDSGEFVNVAGTNISLAANSSGTLAGIGNYSVTRVGNTVTLQLSGISASNDQIAGLIDGLRYGNSSGSVTAGSRAVTLTSVSDSGGSNSTTALNLTSSVNVLTSNAALYVTSGNDTGANALFGSSIQDDANDGGGLSLREALYWANNTSGVDRIVFQTDVTLASSIITPTQTMLIDGQSFKLNGNGYAGFQITTSSITFAIQNLTLTNFSTLYNETSGGILGLAANVSNVNLRLYNVDFSNNADDGLGNGIIDLYNLGSGAFNFDFDRVNFHDNILYGIPNNGDGVIRLFVSGTMQTVNLSLTNSAFVNNNRIANNYGTSLTSGLYLTGNQADPVNTRISLSNVTFSGQTTGIVFEFSNSLNWNLTARNTIMEGTNSGYVINNLNNVITGTVNVNLIGTNNLIGANVVNQVSATDPRLAVTATNAISQGSRYYVTGDGDVRGLDNVRQGSVDIGAYASQYLAGNAPQVDLNGSNSGSDYSAGISTGLSNGVAIADSLATLSQTDGDSRIWTMTLALSGVQDSGSESLTLSSSARLAAHAAGITVTSNGQTLTLTGGATVEAFQTVLRAIMYVNVATTPTGGTRTIAVTVNDDATSTATSSLTIAVGSPPVVSATIPAQSIAQNGSLSFMVPAGTFTDPDNDALILSATLVGGSSLPSWMTFDPVTGTFSGTPGNADVGSLSIKVTATDTGSNSVSATFSLTVTNVNDAPVVAMPVPAQAMLQGQSLSFTVPAGTFSDPDGDTLTLSATLADGSALPTWLTFNPTTRTFSGTPGNADVGHLSIKVTATDPDNASASTPYELFVLNVNDAPEVATPIPAQSIAQNGSLSFTVPAGTFSDPDGDTLTLSATLADGSALPAWLTFNPATDTFSGTPGHADVGSLSIKITANDWDASVSTTFSLTVTNVNDAPVVAMPVPAQGVLQGHSLSFTVPAGTFSDPDGDTLTLSATLADGSALPTWLTFNPTTRTFSGTPGNADVGHLSIKVTATDPDNASASTPFELFVVNVNDAPEVATPIPAQSIAQNGSLSFTVPAGTFSDPDGDFLTLSVTLADGSALPAWLTFNPATGTFSGTPGHADVGSLSIKITANDGDASVSTTFSLMVTNVNDAPVIIAPVSITVTEDVSSVIAGFSFTDVDAGANTVTATFSVPSGTLSATTGLGVTVGGSGTGLLTLTGSLADINAFIGLDSLTFQAAQDPAANVVLTVTFNDKGFSGSGGEKTDTKTVTLIVSAVNDAPVNNVPGAQTAQQNIALGFNDANGNAISITDVDAGNGLMTVTLTATNGTLSLSSLSGLTLLLGTGTNDASMIFEGNRANINAALQTLSFKSGSTFHGAASLTIETNDNGNTGSGGARTDVDTISINVILLDPKVTNVSAQGLDRTVKIGDEVLINMTWDQVVNVDINGGSPTLLLETGLVDREAVYVSGSGSNTLVFKYIVQAGDTSADLDFQSTVALQLNNAVLTNTTGDVASLTLPTVGGADSLGGRSNIVVDGVVPVVTSVGMPSDGTYIVGQNLDFTVNFSENVVVDTTGGTPRIAVTLDTGGTVYANYVSGSGSSALVFRLTVASGQLDANGVTLGSAVQLNNGSIRDAAGNDTVVTLNSVASTANVNVDGVAPTVVSVGTPANGGYNAGDVLTFTVNASEALQTGGLPPRLVLDVGGATRYATYVSGSGSAALVFQYTVQAGDNDGDGIAVGSLDLRGEQLTDLAGNDLNLTLNGVGSTAGVEVDTIAPVIVSMVLDQTTLNAQQTAVLTVRFSEAVTGLDVSDFTVVDGVLSGLSSADGGITWTATLTPVVGKVQAGIQVALNNAGYTDLAGNAGTNTSWSASYAINTVLPAQPVLQVESNVAGNATVRVDALEAGAPWEYSLDGGQSWQAGQGHVVAIASPGLYNVQVRQTNAVGNVSEAGVLTVDVAPLVVPPSAEWPVMGVLTLAGAHTDVWGASLAPVVFAPFGFAGNPALVPRGSGDFLVGSGSAAPAGTMFFSGGVATVHSELSLGFLGEGGIGDSRVIGASALTGMFAPPATTIDRLVLLQPVEAVVVAAGRQVDWKVPPTMFGHSDPLASLQFSMTQASGQPLPAWLRFDARTGRVSGEPPSGFKGELTLRLTARDNQGNVVSTVITFKAADAGAAPRAGVAEQLQRHAQLRAGQMAAQRLHL